MRLTPTLHEMQTDRKDSLCETLEIDHCPSLRGGLCHDQSLQVGVDGKPASWMVVQGTGSLQEGLLEELEDVLTPASQRVHHIRIQKSSERNDSLQLCVRKKAMRS
jgi:hypothetical protein